MITLNKRIPFACFAKRNGWAFAISFPNSFCNHSTILHGSVSVISRCDLSLKPRSILLRPKTQELDKFLLCRNSKWRVQTMLIFPLWRDVYNTMWQCFSVAIIMRSIILTFETLGRTSEDDEKRDETYC